MMRVPWGNPPSRSRLSPTMPVVRRFTRPIVGMSSIRLLASTMYTLYYIPNSLKVSGCPVWFFAECPPYGLFPAIAEPFPQFTAEEFPTVDPWQGIGDHEFPRDLVACHMIATVRTEFFL